jgi:hypothetical protein
MAATDERTKIAYVRQAREALQKQHPSCSSDSLIPPVRRSCIPIRSGVYRLQFTIRVRVMAVRKCSSCYTTVPAHATQRHVRVTHAAYWPSGG